jgi:hypothetical protein
MALGIAFTVARLDDGLLPDALVHAAPSAAGDQNRGSHECRGVIGEAGSIVRIPVSQGLKAN